MASSVNIVTQALTRDLLAEFAGNHRVVKFMENLTQDVTVGIPDGMDALEAQVQGAQFLADLVSAIAQAALKLAEQATEGPPVPVPAARPDDAPPQLLAPPTEVPDDLSAQVAELRSRLAAAENRIAQIEGEPTP